ncbi:protein kinase [Paenibacillus sp. HJL G12]|uniref:Protein kinase n=1 Tax=Paenibacillus dendrobii TaxID=2691084 RepID=A0A7X3IEX9_9BACL|nr:protein kinase [Paenibacillus dendrobii]MWV42236.1 protein kinase [Paenibacillus dendrobii]
MHDITFHNNIITVNKKTQIVINNLQIQEQLGNGANGVVFKCLDTLFNRTVALKLWMPRKGQKYPDPDRFKAEVQKLAALENEAIVSVFTGDYQNGYCYAVMEYIPGVTLEKWLDRSRNEKEKLKYAQKIIKVMEYSHAEGIYHGDLHAENIMINDDQVKILDFGTSIFSPASSMLRASYLMSQTLGKLIPEKYYSLIHPQIVQFIETKNWNVIRDMYSTNDYVSPEYVLGSFEVLIEFIAADMDYFGKLTDVHRLYNDLALYLMRAPFLQLNNLVELLEREYSKKEVTYFFDRFWDHAFFSESHIIELMSEEFKDLISNMTPVDNALQMYDSLNLRFIYNSDEYMVWRDFYSKYIKFDLESLLII